MLVFEFLHQQLAARSGERHDQIVIGGVALAWFLCERDANGFVGGFGNPRVDVHRRRQRRMNVSGHDLLNSVRFEWDVAGHRVIKSPAEAVHVGQKILSGALDFFGSNVIGRSPDGSLILVIVFRAACEAEIDQLRFAIFVE